jgi:hypothetical protein
LAKENHKVKTGRYRFGAAEKTIGSPLGKKEINHKCDPLLASMHCPVIHRLSGEARKAATSANVALLFGRRIGMRQPREAANSFKHKKILIRQMRIFSTHGFI